MAAEQLLEEDLFGDYVSDTEDPAPAAAGEKRSVPEAAEARPAKAPKVDVSQFFEREAEEAGGSGDEEEEAVEGLIDDEGVDTSAKGKALARSELQRAAQQAELDEVAADLASRGPDVGARRVFGSSFLDRLEERYQDAEGAGEAVPRSPGARSAESARGSSGTYIVPAPTDPKIWCCRTFGPENQLCISLMTKAGEWLAKGLHVPIFSVFFSPHLRGYIYIEAFREADIRRFILGIRGISPWSISVVPLAQMPLVFQASVTNADEKKVITAGDWVRCKRKPYHGDLAQVEEIRDEEITIKIKPRLQFQMEEGGKLADRESREARKRAAPRWFIKSDVVAAGMMVNVIERHTSKGRQWFFLVGDDIYREGFIYKTVKSGMLITGEQVRPQERELQDWKLSPPVGDETVPKEERKVLRDERERNLMPPPSVLPRRMAPMELVEGDIVIVNTGDLVNLKGRVVKALFQAKTVTVKPLGVAANAPDLNLAIATLSKYFEVGDYVKVVDGERQGDTGYVMGMDFGRGPKWNRDSTARILSSGITTEYVVRVEQIRRSAQKADQAMASEEFRVGQLVVLDGRNGVSRGMITRLEIGSRATVLATTGQKLDVALQELAPTKETKMSREVWTQDRRGDRLRVQAVVKAPRGMAKAAPIRAEIMYIVNDVCFLRAEEGLTGERAFLVASGQKCELVYDKGMDRELEASAKGRKTQKTEDKPPETKQGMLQYGVQMASQTDWLQPWFKEMMGMPDNAANVTQKGSNVRITGGGYKGLRGEVRDFLGDTVRVSLLCKPKLVTINMNFIAPDEVAAKKRIFKARPVADGGAPQPEFISPGTPIDEDRLYMKDQQETTEAGLELMRGTPDGPPALANEPMSKHDTAPEIDWWAPDIDFDAPGASTPTRADPDGGALGASDAVGTPKALSDGCATPQPQGALAAPAPRTPLPATPATTPTPSEAHGDGRPRLPCRKKSRSSRIPSEGGSTPRQSPAVAPFVPTTERAAHPCVPAVPTSTPARAWPPPPPRAAKWLAAAAAAVAGHSMEEVRHLVASPPKDERLEVSAPALAGPSALGAAASSGTEAAADPVSGAAPLPEAVPSSGLGATLPADTPLCLAEPTPPTGDAGPSALEEPGAGALGATLPTDTPLCLAEPTPPTGDAGPSALEEPGAGALGDPLPSDTAPCLAEPTPPTGDAGPSALEEPGEGALGDPLPSDMAPCLAEPTPPTGDMGPSALEERLPAPTEPETED